MRGKGRGNRIPSGTPAAVAARARREAETQEHRDARLQQNRDQRARNLAAESADERESRLEARRVNHAATLAAESAEERDSRLEARRERHAATLAAESAAERDSRLEARRERQAANLAAESAEERESRLEARRARQAAESAQERESRLEARRVNHAATLAAESAAERDSRLEARRERHAVNLAAESAEEREVRHELERNRKAEKRKMQRELDQVRVTRARTNESDAQREARQFADRVRYQQRQLRKYGNMRRAAVLGSANYTNRPQVHNLGPMIMNCAFDFCKALHFFAEEDIRNLLHSCCHSGKIKTPPLMPYPDEFKDLLTGTSQASRKFREHIRQYNCANAFASFGATNVAIPGHGPYCFKISGEVHHLATSSLVAQDPEQPAGAPTPKYGQIFVYDPESAVRYRMSRKENAQCDEEIMATIDRTMRALPNPYVEGYRILDEVARREGSTESELILARNPRDDPRRYKEPTSNRECMYLVESGEGEIPLFDLAVHPINKIGCRRLHPSSRHADPMIFPLLFPHGEPGYYIHVPNGLKQFADQKVTPVRFYSSRIAVKEGQFNPLHHAGKLFQQYLVNAYCTIERERLTYLRGH